MRLFKILAARPGTDAYAVAAFANACQHAADTKAVYLPNPALFGVNGMEAGDRNKLLVSVVAASDLPAHIKLLAGNILCQARDEGAVMQALGCSTRDELVVEAYREAIRYLKLSATGLPTGWMYQACLKVIKGLQYLDPGVPYRCSEALREVNAQLEREGYAPELVQPFKYEGYTSSLEAIRCTPVRYANWALAVIHNRILYLEDLAPQTSDDRRDYVQVSIAVPAQMGEDIPLTAAVFKGAIHLRNSLGSLVDVVAKHPEGRRYVVRPVDVSEDTFPVYSEWWRVLRTFTDVAYNWAQLQKLPEFEHYTLREYLAEIEAANDCRGVFNKLVTFYANVAEFVEEVTGRAVRHII